MKLSISYLKSKYDFSETIKKLSKTDAEYIHVDVMDGIFVTNKTKDLEVIKDNLLKSEKELDIHFMVENPIPYIIKYKVLKPKFITFHCEIEHNIDDLIDLVHSFNIKCGIAINPNTSLENIKKYFKKIDLILIMSVNPGLGGQKFNHEVISKIEELNYLRKISNFNYLINIDGGINDEVIKDLDGLDIITSGSFICESDDYQLRIDKLRKNYK